MNRLRGRRISGSDGPIGVLNDVYFDPSVWRVRYLALEAPARARKPRLIVPAAHARIEGISEEDLVVRLKRAGIPPGAVPGRHLVSAREAASLRIEAADGPAAPVEDVLVGIDWSIAGFLVGVRNWVLPGTPVELPPGAVERIDRDSRVLRVRLTRQQILRLPRSPWRIAA